MEASGSDQKEIKNKRDIIGDTMDGTDRVTRFRCCLFRNLFRDICVNRDKEKKNLATYRWLSSYCRQGTSFTQLDHETGFILQFTNRHRQYY